MKYPISFIKQVKKEFPGWKSLFEALDRGSDFVGRYLDDSRGFSLGPEDVIKFLKRGEQNKVLEAAKKAVRRHKLYVKWCSLRG